MGKTYSKVKAVKAVSRKMYKDMPLGKVHNQKDKDNERSQNWREYLESYQDEDDDQEYVGEEFDY